MESKNAYQEKLEAQARVDRSGLIRKIEGEKSAGTVSEDAEIVRAVTSDQQKEASEVDRKIQATRADIIAMERRAAGAKESQKQVVEKKEIEQLRQGLRGEESS